MRIFTAVRHSLDPRFYYGGLWAENFHPALRRLGHEVVESPIDLLPASRFMSVEKPFTPEEQTVRGDLTERIVADVAAEHARQPLDLVLTYFYDSHFDPAGYGEIRRLGVPTVNFYCNSIHQFDLAREVSAGVDFAWHAERDAALKYRGLGANPVWVQMGADPELYHPIEAGPRAPVASFVGARYADRDRWVAALVRSGLPVHIYGARWPCDGSQQPEPSETSKRETYLGRRSVVPGSLQSYLREIRHSFVSEGVSGGVTRTLRQIERRRSSRRLDSLLRPVVLGKVSFDGMLRVYSSSELVLNFSNVWSDCRTGSPLVPHVRLRDFEAPMCRCCYLTGASDEIREFYEVGREIDTYSALEEFIEKVRFYLRHPHQAERLREAGYRRARRDHTWDNRFQQLFRKIGLVQ